MSALGPSSRPLSISNIAWPSEADEAAIDLVAELGFDGIELAPGKVFGDVATVPLKSVRAYGSRLRDAGLTIPALQGILFGIRGAHLFQTDESRSIMAEHLCRVAEIAAELGAYACVFGAPSLRDPGNLSTSHAWDEACGFFRKIASHFEQHGATLCFEANPPLYGCRFITETLEAFRLVEAVDCAGFSLQLDTGTIFINDESADTINTVSKRVDHIHISEPSLAPLGTSGVGHAAIARAIAGSRCKGWMSIEMRAGDAWEAALHRAHGLVRECYYSGAHDGR